MCSTIYLVVEFRALTCSQSNNTFEFVALSSIPTVLASFLTCAYNCHSLWSQFNMPRTNTLHSVQIQNRWHLWNCRVICETDWSCGLSCLMPCIASSSWEWLTAYVGQNTDFCTLAIIDLPNYSYVPTACLIPVTIKVENKWVLLWEASKIGPEYACVWACYTFL